MLPPFRRTRSPTRNGRALRRMSPAKRLPSVCWAASPTMTAVNAPPTASVPRSRPAIRSAASTATAVVARRMRKTAVPAVPFSRRRNSTGCSQRPTSRASIHPSPMSATAVAMRIGSSSPVSSRRLTYTAIVAAMSSAASRNWLRARRTAWALSCRASPASRQNWRLGSASRGTCRTSFRRRQTAREGRSNALRYPFATSRNARDAPTAQTREHPAACRRWGGRDRRGRVVRGAARPAAQGQSRPVGGPEGPRHEARRARSGWPFSTSRRASRRPSSSRPSCATRPTTRSRRTLSARAGSPSARGTSPARRSPRC